MDRERETDRKREREGGRERERGSAAGQGGLLQRRDEPGQAQVVRTR